jgi:hypothetical protein
MPDMPKISILNKKNSNGEEKPKKMVRSNSVLKKDLAKKQSEIVKIEQYKDYVIQNNVSPDQIVKQ